MFCLAEGTGRQVGTVPWHRPRISAVGANYGLCVGIRMTGCYTWASCRSKLANYFPVACSNKFTALCKREGDGRKLKHYANTKRKSYLCSVIEALFFVTFNHAFFIPSSVRSFFEATLCQGDVVALTCPIGFGINVTAALYGRTGNSECQNGRHDPNSAEMNPASPCTLDITNFLSQK